MVRNGHLKATSLISANAKTYRLSALLYSNTTSKKDFESIYKFKPSSSVSVVRATLWDSTLRQLSSIAQLNVTTLTEVCGSDFCQSHIYSDEMGQGRFQAYLSNFIGPRTLRRPVPVTTWLPFETKHC